MWSLHILSSVGWVARLLTFQFRTPKGHERRREKKVEREIETED
jgi:hypothetical protein